MYLLRSCTYFSTFSPCQSLTITTSHNLVMKHIPGADPELVLLNHYYEELDVSLCLAVYLCFLVLVYMKPIYAECDCSVYCII